MSFFSSWIFAGLILPLLIFTARILDVSLGTIRIILVSKGMKNFAPLFGFFEVFIWLLAIGQIMKDITNLLLYLAYSAGFAMGTFVGIQLENKLSLGMALIRIITRREASELIKVLRSQHHGFTVVDAQGPSGQVHIIYSIIHRHDLQEVIEDIKRYDPHAFYTVEDVRFVSEEIFPSRGPWHKKLFSNSFRLIRKGK